MVFIIWKNINFLGVFLRRVRVFKIYKIAEIDDSYMCYFFFVKRRKSYRRMHFPTTSSKPRIID